MRMSPREMTLGLITLFVIIGGVTFFLLRSRIDKWEESSDEKSLLKERIEQERALIDRKDAWSKQYESLKGLVPEISASEKVDVRWMSLMEQKATARGLSIARRRGKGETRVGDVYEFPIECSDCRGTLDAFVGFLFDLQSEGAMLDVRYIQLKRRNNTGPMLGNFTLYCAYTKSEAEESE